MDLTIAVLARMQESAQYSNLNTYASNTTQVKITERTNKKKAIVLTSLTF